MIESAHNKQVDGLHASVTVTNTRMREQQKQKSCLYIQKKYLGLFLFNKIYY